MIPMPHESLSPSLGHLCPCQAESCTGHLQSGKRLPVPASPVARQGQQPAVLALLPACSESHTPAD